MNCSKCHICGKPINYVLDGEEWCKSCGVYQRPYSHGWGRGEDTPCLITLTCIRDACPITNKMVDYRKCTECHYFKTQIQIGTIECTHPDATKQKGKGYSGDIRYIVPSLAQIRRI